MLLTVGLWTARVQPSDRGTEPRGARWLSDLHAGRESILQEDASSWMLVVHVLALERGSTNSRVRASADACSRRDGMSTVWRSTWT